MRIESGNFKPLSNNENKAQQPSKQESASASASKDVYKFQVSAQDLNQFFELAKRSERVREDKIREARERMEKGEHAATGRDVVFKVLEEKSYGTRHN